jgi:hypothetical protein
MRFLVTLSRFAMVFVALSLLSGVATAKDIYIAQSAAGANSGLDCADAHSVSFFNTAANWGPGAAQIGPGTTAHLCGVITTELTVQASGSGGSPITILFQPNAQVALPACDNSNGCLNINGKSYITIDGGTPCGPGTACASTAMACVANASACGTGSIVQTSNGTGALAITNITCSGGVATVTGPSPFGFSLAPYPGVLPIQISGNSVSSYNGTWTVASDNDSNNTFTINVSCNGTGTGGTAGVLCPSGSYCANDSDAIMVDAQNQGCSNCEVRNMIVGPFRYRTSYRDVRSEGANGTMFFAGTTGTLKIHDNVMPYGGVNYVPIASGDSGLSIYNNEIYNFNRAISIASSNGGSVLSGAQIYGNYLHDSQVWDAPGCPTEHNGIHMWGLGGGTIANVNVYNNWIGGNFGGCATGALFFEGANRNIQMYNNLVNIKYTQAKSGIFRVNGDGVGGGYQIYNNTIIGNWINDTCIVIGGPGNSVSFANNIVTGCWATILVQDTPSIKTWDYNIYGCQNLRASSCTAMGASNFVTEANGTHSWLSLAGWQSACSCDSHAAANYGTTGLATNSNGTPQSSSPAIGAGTNLTSLSIAALKSDRSGNARPSSGPWTVGAYNSPSSSAAPPSSLSVVVK